LYIAVGKRPITKKNGGESNDGDQKKRLQPPSSPEIINCVRKNKTKRAVKRLTFFSAIVMLFFPSVAVILIVMVLGVLEENCDEREQLDEQTVKMTTEKQPKKSISCILSYILTCLNLHQRTLRDQKKENYF
jgi:hypothetical protein